MEDRIIREPERRRIMGTSSVTQWRMERAGTAPRRVEVNKGIRGWRLSEILSWVESRQFVVLGATHVDSIQRGRKPKKVLAAA